MMTTPLGLPRATVVLFLRDKSNAARDSGGHVADAINRVN
jgi:hypothetical protein